MMDIRLKNCRSAEVDQMVMNCLEDLRELLISKGIDMSLWGINNAKRVENLWDEIVEGESQVQEDPLLRVISVVTVFVWRESRILIEAEQDLSDGRTRARNLPPSEKMKPGETDVEAAVRCLEEELQVPRDRIRIIPSAYGETYKEMVSPSYPGLNTRYIFHKVEAAVEGLPGTGFSTAEVIHNEKDPVREHHWIWIPKDQVNGMGE